MSRLLAAALLAGIAVASTPGSARAQWGRGAYLMGPNPFYVYPTGSGYGVQLNFGINAMTPYGPLSFGYGYPYTFGPQAYTPSFTPGYYSGPGYLTGGSYSNFDPLGAQQGLAAAQQAAGQAQAKKNQEQARELIDAQRAYETLGVTGQTAVVNAQDQSEALQKALAVKDESEVASGVALNRILVAIVVAQNKGGKGVSAFLPPQLLDDVRFTGGATADLLNLVRQSGKLPFPPNFPGPTLQDLQRMLDSDFAAAIAPLRVGKPVDPAKVQALATTLRKVEAASPPVVRNLSFEDAFAARKFLNQMDSAVAVLKGTATAGLLNTKWATDGVSVADLVKFMTRFKLMFGPAPAGTEGSYLSLHKALVTYLFVLNQSLPKKG